MRVFITAVIILVNFILQTTLFPLLSIGGVFPNTALIIVTSYALLRGSKEGAVVGAATGLFKPYTNILMVIVDVLPTRTISLRYMLH